MHTAQTWRPRATSLGEPLSPNGLSKGGLELRTSFSMRFQYAKTGAPDPPPHLFNQI